MTMYRNQASTVSSVREERAEVGLDRQFEPEAIREALGTDSVSYLGTGAFGETWRAQLNNVETACKIIYRLDNSPERLAREIASYKRVRSANVVTLYRARYISVNSERRVCLEFEYIEGGDLAKAVAEQRKPAERELHSLARGLLNGVAALHSADLLHRDLKPANIALRNGDFSLPVILDLGLAKLLDLESITRYPTHVGTAMYMAPEQLRQERALRASDLWAVGVVLHEAATGVHPYFTEGETLTWEDVFKRLECTPDTSDLAPLGVAELIRRCLSDPPHKRGTVRKALERLEQ